MYTDEPQRKPPQGSATTPNFSREANCSVVYLFVDGTDTFIEVDVVVVLKTVTVVPSGAVNVSGINIKQKYE